MYKHAHKNKSGTSTVKVRLKHGRETISDVTIGTAAEGTAEYDLLQKEADEYMREQTGEIGTLFDQVEEDAADEASPPPSVPEPTPEQVSLVLSRLRISSEGVRIHGPEAVYGHFYDKVGFGAVHSGLYRHLVLCRLFRPCSKRKTVEHMESDFGVRYTTNQVYYFMDKICPRESDKATETPSSTVTAKGSRDIYEVDHGDGFSEEDKVEVPAGIKKEVEDISFNWTRRHMGGIVTACFYDCTTLYFESEDVEDEEDPRKTGWSKDGKGSNPQVVIGMLIAGDGYPIGYDVFPGNTYEGHTLMAVLEKLCSRYGIEAPVVVADAGLLNARNIELLEAGGYQYILGAKVKNMAEAVKDKIRGKGLKSGESMTVRLDAKKHKRLIVTMSDSRAKRDAKNARKGLDKLKKRSASGKLTKGNLNNKGYNKYLKMEGDVAVSIDYERFEQDKVWYGIKGYITNTKMGKSLVISSYGTLWRIERLFRMNKTDLRIRPIYHRLVNRIYGHINICYAAYVVEIEMEHTLKRFKSDLTVDMVKGLVGRMYTVRCTDPFTGQTIYLSSDLNDAQKELMSIIGQDQEGSD